MNEPKKTAPEDSFAGTLAAGEATTSPLQPDDLHDLFAAGVPGTMPDEEDPLAVLRNDPNYAALIRDLEYIASQARLLFEPTSDGPSDEVWTKIQSELQKPHDA